MGFILVFDITNPQSFVNIRDWLEQLRTHSYSYDPVVILVGNKIDLHERKIEKADAERLAMKSDLKYIETSAKTGENVREALDMLLDIVWERMMKSVPVVGDPQLHSLVPNEDEGGAATRRRDSEFSGRKGCCS